MRPYASEHRGGGWRKIPVAPRALPPEERQRLYPHLQLVALPLGMVIYESGARLRHIYFPTDCIVSLLYVLDRPRLEKLSCECYAVVKKESDRLPGRA